MSASTCFTTLGHEVTVTSSPLMPMALPSCAPPNMELEGQFPMLNIKLLNKTNKSLPRWEKLRMEARAPDIWLENDGNFEREARNVQEMHKLQRKMANETHQPRNARFSSRAAVIVRNKSFRDRLLDSCRKMTDSFERRRVMHRRCINCKERWQTKLTSQEMLDLVLELQLSCVTSRSVTVCLIPAGNWCTFWEGEGWVYADGYSDKK